ncbi:hypothetical protein [Longimicrobium sp.]|uniref:hypothetical protein n=1 Tax=Longimicrobium sp. TaxID=2029185 RepID=UPI002EDA1011
MKKRLPELQPAHESSRVTVAQAAAAFRKVRGSNPKPGLWGPDDPVNDADQSGPENGRPHKDGAD